MTKIPVQLSIRDFAVPVPRVGSIDSHSGYGRSSLDGIEIHQLIQRRREAQHSNYTAEVKISHEIESERYVFQVSGRMDGVFDSEPAHIEEIKTTFNIRELKRALQDNPAGHPYCLQLLTYGYFYWLKNRIIPKLSFYLVSTRNSETDELEIELDLEVYEAWLELRTQELTLEAERAEKRSHRRKKTAQDLRFPFENPRNGQIELIESIRSGIQTRSKMLIQAPTGLGKTVGVMFPALEEALSRGQRLLYVTPKNSQHSVAEDAVERFQDTGASVKSLTVTAKSKICMKAEPLCNPKYCEYAKDHYTKVALHELPQTLSKKRKLTARTFRDLAEKFEVCPFELQLLAAEEADVVICDYNYVFAPRSALGRNSSIAIEEQGKPNLVIDEAHNLPSRAMDYYSPSLSTGLLASMRDEVRELPMRFRMEAEELLDECIAAVNSCKPPSTPDSGEFQIRSLRSVKIDPPQEPFLDQDERLRAFLSRYLDSDVEIEPGDVVLRLSFYWAEFTGALEYVGTDGRKEFFTSYQSTPTGGTIKITCCDASAMLKSCYDDFDQVVGFSATLKPFDFYAKLSGLNPSEVKLSEFRSPFSPKNRKVLIIPQISTKYSDRSRNYPKIAEAISKIAAIRPGNYFAFFPSFEFLERVLDLFIPPLGFSIRRQERGMKNSDSESLIEHLKSGAEPTLVFAVQGGIFSEGVDYPGETIIGAFVIGPPLPVFDLEREEMRKYYDENYSSGFEFAYTYPAMAKAIQAAGRVIRSETDRGIIILMDGRFVQPSYSQSMPEDWFNESPLELVSNSILREVDDFWRDDQ